MNEFENNVRNAATKLLRHPFNGENEAKDLTDADKVIAYFTDLLSIMETMSGNSEPKIDHLSICANRKFMMREFNTKFTINNLEKIHPGVRNIKISITVTEDPEEDPE